MVHPWGSPTFTYSTVGSTSFLKPVVQQYGHQQNGSRLQLMWFTHSAAAAGTYHTLTGILTGNAVRKMQSKRPMSTQRGALVLPWEKGKTIYQTFRGQRVLPVLTFCSTTLSLKQDLPQQIKLQLWINSCLVPTFSSWFSLPAWSALIRK